MKINSRTHSLITIKKSYLYLSRGKIGDEYEMLPDEFSIKLIGHKGVAVHDLNVLWLVSRGYFLDDSVTITGLPTITLEDLPNYTILDHWIMRCNCEINPLHIHKPTEPPICSECGSNLLSINPPPIMTEETDGYFNEEDENGEIMAGGIHMLPSELFKKYDFSNNREHIYRKPPKGFKEILAHLRAGTIFSLLKVITRKEIEEHAKKYRLNRV